MDNPSIRHRILKRDAPSDTFDAAQTAAVRLEAPSTIHPQPVNNGRNGTRHSINLMINLID